MTSLWAIPHRLAAQAPPPPANAKVDNRLRAGSDEWKALKAKATAELASGDAGQIDEAVTSLRGAAMRLDAKEKAIEVLFEAKRYDDAEQLAVDVTLANAQYTMLVAVDEKLRARSFLAQHKYPEALSAARSYFDTALLKDSSDAIHLVAMCLSLAKPDDPTLARRFKQQQVAWATAAPGSKATSQPAGGTPADGPAGQASVTTTQPGDGLGDPVLATIPPDAKPYADAVDGIDLDSYMQFCAKGNLLLLTGNAADARAIFDRAESFAPDAKAAEAISNIARAIRAEAGCIAPANDYILKRRNDP